MIVQTFRNKIQGRLRYYANQAALSRPLSLKPKGRSQGDVLVSYFQEPFQPSCDPSVLNTHSRYWESFQVAQTFLDLGYSVDVIDWRNRVFTPTKPYVVLIDPRDNVERLAPLVPKDCIKVFYIDVAHTLFNSRAEMDRMFALQQRRGVTLKLRRFEYPNFGIEYADCGTMLGNDFTLRTFDYAKKPIYKIPMTPAMLFPWEDTKNYETCRRNFLWFGSYGLVHKGLDLVLEAFAQMPDCQLTICGPIANEPDFVAAYERELYHTPNIRTLGWVDVTGQKFREIVNSCAGFVYASSSEGQAGAVVTCMHAGLIPLITVECGVDIPSGAGTVLADCSIETIKQAVRNLAACPSEQLREMSRANWEFARAHYTRDQYAKTYREIAKQLLHLP